MTTAENIILFDLIFSILLLTFGAAAGNVSLSAVQNLPGPPLSPTPNIDCNGLCAPFSGIVAATAYIGWALVNIPVVIGYIVLEAVLLGNIVLGLAFSPSFGPNGVPYLGYFFIGLQVYVVWEAIRTFRGSSTGV